MILLDTNVLSALMLQVPDPAVVAWLDRQPRTSIWTTSVTVLEIRFGIGVLPKGKRRFSLLSAFDRLLDEFLEQRVAPFDAAAAQHAANLMVSRQLQGRSGEFRDTMIAGITLAAHAILATRNTRHFEDIASSVTDPWNA